MASFNIKLDDKPHLNSLSKSDVKAFKSIVGTFVSLMEASCRKTMAQTT
jgi:hypothetical protein